MKNNGKELPVEPFRNDMVYFVIDKYIGSRPLFVAVLYLLVAVGGTLTLEYLTRGLMGGGTGLIPLSQDAMNIINVGVIAPIGAAFLVNLYKQIGKAYLEIRYGNIVIDPEHQLEPLLARLSALYSHKAMVVLAVVLSVSLSGYAMFKKDAWWSGIHGGVAAYYFRLFVAINYYMIILISYKCVVTVWALRKIFGMSIRLQPLHPDRCGGLKPIGDLTISMHYFLLIVLLFLTTLTIFNPDNTANPAFVGAFVGVLSLMAASLFLSISRAHGIMKKSREDILKKLSAEFQLFYETFRRDLERNDYNVEAAEKLQSINALYELSARMPIWPYDTHSLGRFFSGVSIPIVVFLIQLIANADSIIYNLDKLKVLKIFMDWTK